MKTKEQILNDAINEHPFQGLEGEQCKVAYSAMDNYATAMCMELLDYLAKKKVICMSDSEGDFFLMNGNLLTKEQVFENFL